MKDLKHTKRTKRTNLVLDPDQLEGARRILGTKTYSETVDKAIQGDHSPLQDPAASGPAA